MVKTIYDSDVMAEVKALRSVIIDALDDLENAIKDMEDPSD